MQLGNIQIPFGIIVRITSFLCGISEYMQKFDY